jgi:hypothetical protein
MRRDTLQALVPDLKLDGKSDEYVTARLDAALELRANPTGPNDLREPKNDAADKGPNRRLQLHRTVPGKKLA